MDEIDVWAGFELKKSTFQGGDFAILQSSGLSFLFAAKNILCCSVDLSKAL